MQRRREENRIFLFCSFLGVLSPFLFHVRSSKNPETEPFKNQRLVHLDLKGAPPRPEYLVSLFPYFSRLGATGLLIEWEDTLPYYGDLKLLGKSKHVYSQDDVDLILNKAHENGLKVIPLMQSFGHLEFVLKHEKFASLRELSQDLGSLCPSNPQSLPLVLSLMDQVMEMHKAIPIESFHIGGDEVWNLGSCPTCSKKDHSTLFLSHIVPVIQHMNKKGLKVLLWDDMFRTWEVEKLTKLTQYQIQPVVWMYRPSFEKVFPEGMWERYDKVFSGQLWAASAFKGAKEKETVFVPAEMHVQNHLSWLATGNQTDFKGIILTGWSRYWHTAPLCETLPVGIPSLVLNLAILKEGKFNNALKQKVFHQLGFDSNTPLESDKLLSDVSYANSLKEANFPGSDLYQQIYMMEAQKKISPIAKNSSQEAQLRKTLEKYFFPFTVEEFLSTNVI